LHALEFTLRFCFTLVKLLEVLLFPRDRIRKDMQALLELLELFLLELGSSRKIRSVIRGRKHRFVQMGEPGNLSLKA
jgi:hypothetical protein